MSKFILVSAHANRKPHQGLVVKAYYKQDVDNPLEIPHTITVFNRWPPIEVEADVSEYPLNGVYEYPNGKRTSVIHVFSPKTSEGKYVMGLSPQEIVAYHLTKLVKVGQ